MHILPSSLLLVSLVALMLTGSGAILAAPEAGPSAAARAELSPPKLRLDDTARPTRYFLDLTVIPDRDTFTGVVEIDLEIRKPTSHLWLNATDLTIRKADLQVRGRGVPAHLVPGNEDFLAFTFDRPVGPGAARLRVAYQGKLSEKDRGGLFRRKDGDHWYAFSQFEPIDARRAFPCFDEPSFKVPWQLTLHVKKEHVALSNTPILSVTDEPDGMKAVCFARTKPLPSYLVALAVGPCDIVDAGKAGKKKTPIRIVTPRGRAAEAGYPVRTTGEILKLLEEYFGIPYPYEKLDIVAVPQFPGMENPGLITCDQRWLLTRPENQSIQYQRTYAWFCAHELAHQWFGNLVTMAWWDDIWLNEGFGTWIDTKIVDQWKPEWRVKAETSRAYAMSQDSLQSARKVRQPIVSKHDIANAFDNITYEKGAAVMEMFEAWLGEEEFRKGVRRYLKRHAWGNATSQDFLAALSEETGRDVAPAFATFVEQTGVPVVTAELKCEEGATPRLVLAQDRYRQVGSPALPPQTWQIPIRVLYGVGKSRRSAATLLTRSQGELPLPGAGQCPECVLVNPGAAGYYRVRYRGDLLTRLLDRKELLTLTEQVNLLGDIRALVRSGELPAGEALALVPRFLTDWNRHLVSGTWGLTNLIESLIPEGLRPQLQRFIRDTYGAKARELGWQPRPGETEDTQLLRRTLLAMVAGVAEEPVLSGEAAALARRWLEDRKAVAPDLIQLVLVIAARDGDRALFARFREEARKTSDLQERGSLLWALGAFRDPEITREALGILLTDEFPALEAQGILRSAGGDPQAEHRRYEFIKQNFEALVARFPKADVWQMGANLPDFASGFSDEGHLADVEAFFKDRAPRFTGGPRILAQVLEQIRLNIALKKAQMPSVESFLQQYGTAPQPASTRKE